MNSELLTAAVIENIHPSVDGGLHPIKRVVGDELAVEADIFKDGHDQIAANLKCRKVGEIEWQQTPMHFVENDLWRGALRLYEIGLHEYTIEAWQDTFATWLHDFEKKVESGQTDLKTEIEEGALLIESAIPSAKRSKANSDAKILQQNANNLRKLNKSPGARPSPSVNKALELVQNTALRVLMTLHEKRELVTEHPPLQVYVDRSEARFSAWYEFFPRSAAGDSKKGSTLREALSRVDDAKKMGFNVIYFPPIHPIGITARKGPNNSTKSGPKDPGSPYAIGSKKGGHKSIDPDLGTIEDFRWLADKVRARNMEIALDFAINCSPDHPYVKDHPEWFFHRPDGTIKYAENPPKKYEDIYPLNFHNPSWSELWDEMKSILLFWAENGVRIFRVDNPHTKPVVFWKWLIREVQAKFPDVIFLSEAFTRPKMMKVLAKVGFTQSYTYFTWRTSKSELVEYFTELTQTEMNEYYRGNLFTNTPDILPYHLQNRGRAAFQIRFILAATLSSVYGIYSGFELCENIPIPGREEYLDSEKYQFKKRDWNAPGNIKDWITRINQIRESNRALHFYDNLKFQTTSNEQIICYSKTTPSKDNNILVVVNLDPDQSQSAFIDVPLQRFGITGQEEVEGYRMKDLLTGESYHWRGKSNFILLDPTNRPAHILRLERN